MGRTKRTNGRPIRAAVPVRHLTRGIYAIFFLSGISGLLYQVIWVRWFGRVFGNTVYSAALVTAVFMFGLGVGSYLAGRWIDRRASRDPGLALRVYAYLEFGIGALGVVIAFILPALEPVAAHVSAYSISANGWNELSALSYVLRYALSVALLAPITLLMGATLTVLIRYLLNTDIELVGWRVGFLYGFNTAGAALGAFLSDFALIPHVGLFGSHMIAVVLNLIAGVAALRVARCAPAMPARAEEGDTAPDRDMPGEVSAPIVFTGLAIFLSGFCAMGFEILWFRHFSTTLGGFRSVFSLLLVVILVGMWLGSITGGACHRRFGHPGLLYMISQGGFVTLSLLLLGLVTSRRGTVALPEDPFGLSLGYDFAVAWAVLRPMVLIVGVPAVLMGATFPLANAHIQRTAGQIGRRAGGLYLANTAGAVLGSVCAGFVLLPLLGLKESATVLASLGTGAILSIYLATRERGGSRVPRAGVAVVCTAVALAAVVVWVQLPGDLFRRVGVNAGETVLAVSDGVNELVTVVECDTCYDGRILRTNGHNMSGTAPQAQRYMRAFSHLPLLHMQDPTDVLVICFGVGLTVHAASLHPSVQRIEVADLSRNVLNHAHYFRDANHDVLSDERVHVFVNDGRQHLWMRDEGSYDLITLEPPPIGLAGVSALYSREFYALARSRLRDGGFMSQWLPAYQLPEVVVRSIIRSFIDVFPNAILLSGERKELILLGANAPAFTLAPDSLQAALDRRPRVKDDLRLVDLETPVEIFGMFVASSTTLALATRLSAPVTDDHPMMEYAASAVNCARTRFPRDVIDLSGFAAWCPSCVVDGRLAASIADLGDYTVVLNGYYQSEAFLEYGGCSVSPSAIELPIPPDSPVFQRYPYLGTVLAPVDNTRERR